MRRLGAAALLLAALASCGNNDDGDMTKEQAIAECQRYVHENNTGDTLEFKKGVQADKDDMFWEVRGTTQAGGYRCTVDAVKHEAFSATFDKAK